MIKIKILQTISFSQHFEPIPFITEANFDWDDFIVVFNSFQSDM